MINLNTPINSFGYGVVGYNVWRQLSDKAKVALFPIGNRIEPPVNEGQRISEKLQEDFERSQYFDRENPTLKIWHENLLFERLGNNKYYAFPFFEINNFDDGRKHSLNSVDHLFVASEWAKEVCLENNINVPITVSPCGVDRTVFNENNFVLSELNYQKCVFFNCGKWEVRKGHDILHQAFRDAFQSNSDVELWMMNSNPFLTEQESKHWENKYAAENIRIINRVQTQGEVAQIMGQAFCGVFPAKAEGWNLELLEMMSMGKQVIATNYSAHTEFCNNENTKLINSSQTERAYDGKWFTGDVGTWFKFDDDAYDQLVTQLREVYKLWEQNPEHVNSQGIQTAINFNWSNTADIILNQMKEKKIDAS